MEPGGGGEVDDDEELAMGGELRVLLPIIRRVAELTLCKGKRISSFTKMHQSIYTLPERWKQTF
jgi:hypothetical protein